MDFRYRDPSGRTVTLPSTAALLDAIRSGAVTGTTMLAVGDERTWLPAEAVGAYREAKEMLNRLPAGHALRAPGPPPGATVTPGPVSAPAVAGTRTRLLTGTLLAVVLLAGLTVWYGSGVRGRSRPGAALASLTAQVTEIARNLEDLFGDSIALAQRVRQNRRVAFRLERRLSGAGLLSADSLRAIQALADRLRIDASSLVATGESIGDRVIARADSLEREDDQLSGLTLAVTDRIDAWRDDLSRLVRVEQAAATALHDIAAFLMSRQQSFALEAGQPRFLSRYDAQEYAQLWDRLAAAAADERDWAAQMQRKRPRWMASLPEESRPRFGLPLVHRP